MSDKISEFDNTWKWWCSSLAYLVG
jgi:hypothetical protein